MNDRKEDVPIRDAATIILLRRSGASARVLMGQRGRRAVFMPDKFVFPGGRVDDEDGSTPGLRLPPETELARLRIMAASKPEAVLAAAVRELWEETGLVLGRAPENSGARGSSWQEALAAGLIPDAGDLRYVFRAITPPGRPRRFDARFFLCDASAIAGDLDDFSDASDELSHLSWVPLEDAKSLALPFITQVVLSEIEAWIGPEGLPSRIPFFNQTEEGPEFRMIG